MTKEARSSKHDGSAPSVAVGETIVFRLATVEDSPALGALNGQFIRDEEHRNSMTVPQLVERMTGWLRAEYEAVVADERGMIVGYALFRPDVDYLYVRQLFVGSDNRRRGIGRGLIDWLARNASQSVPRIRIDVLVANDAGRRFWESIGFREYCLTMELELPKAPEANAGSPRPE